MKKNQSLDMKYIEQIFAKCVGNKFMLLAQNADFHHILCFILFYIVVSVLLIILLFLTEFIKKSQKFNNLSRAVSFLATFSSFIVGSTMTPAHAVGMIDSITSEDSDTGSKPKVRTDVSPLHPFPAFNQPRVYRAWYPY